MIKYLRKRLLLIIPVLFIISILAFAMLQMGRVISPIYINHRMLHLSKLK